MRDALTEYILNILKKETNASMSSIVSFMKSSCRTNGIIRVNNENIWIVVECCKGAIGEYAHIELWRNDPLTSSVFHKASSVETIILPHELNCHETIVAKLYQFVGVISFVLYKARATQLDGPAAHTTN
jgi:hypothetical protein